MMELVQEDIIMNGNLEEVDIEASEVTPLRERNFPRSHFPGAARKWAYIFDGNGNYYNKDWDLTEGRGKEFCWYHIELPKGNQKLSQSAQYLIDLLCPPLKLQDILSLVSNGSFCGYVDGALVFRVNSPGPASSAYISRLAARITENSVITVSLGRVPRLGFSQLGQSLLSEIPVVETPRYCNGQRREGGGFVIKEHVLEFLLTMNHSEEADNPVPNSVSNLLIHVIDTFVDHLQDIVTKLEIELDSVELELDRGGFALKKQMQDDRRFPKMHLNLQRLLQENNCFLINPLRLGDRTWGAGIPTHKREMFAKTTKHWFASEDIISLEELIGRLRRLKENVGFIANRVTAIQAGLDSWQAEQINRKLYYLSFLSVIFLPLSVVTGVFGMNVGGVPWTIQRSPDIEDGFRNVMLICMVLLVVVLLCFSFPSLYAHIDAWWKKKSLKRSWSLNRMSFLNRTSGDELQERGYLRL